MNKYSVGSRKPSPDGTDGYPIIKTREDGRAVVINCYATPRAAQDVVDMLNRYAYQEVKPVSKKPKEEGK